MPTGPGNGVLAEVCRLAGLAARHDETDRQLLRRFAATRDEAAFELLVRRHGALVRGVCRRVLGNAHDADDVFQATFLVLATKAASVDWRAGIGPWLYQVAYRLARRARAQAARRRLQEARATPLAPAPDDLTWRELRPLLDEELARLPERYRAPLVLCYLEGKTRDEAAALLGTGPGAVKGLLERGRERLRDALAKRGLTLSAALLAAALAQAAGAAPPAGLTLATAQAAALFAAGKGVAALVPAGAVALMKGALYAMFLTKLKLTGAVLTALVVAGAAVGLAARQARAERAPEPARAEKPAPPEKPAAPADPPRDAKPAEDPRAEKKEEKDRPKDPERPKKDEKRPPRPPRPAYTGPVAAVDAGKGTITVTVGREKAREDKTFTLAKDAKVEVDFGKAGKLADLSKGARAQLFLTADKKEVARVVAQGPSREAVIDEVDAKTNTLVLGRGGEGRKEDPYVIAKDVRLTHRGSEGKPGKPFKLSELKVGQTVHIQVSVDMKTIIAITPARTRE